MSRKVKTTNLYGFFIRWSWRYRLRNRDIKEQREDIIKKIKTSYKGRKCKYPHCKQILSIYNHEIYCYVHLVQADVVQRPKVAKLL